jgi:cell division protein FtsL
VTPPAAAAQAVRAPALRARTVVPGRPLRSAPGPRRVSGPARREPVTAPRRDAGARDGLVVGLLAGVQRVSRHRLLDRLIRGRTWIALVAFALIGIVTLQLGLLKLNAGIGRSLERSALLQRENATLSIESSELAAGNRVEATAAHLGMQLVAPGDLRFLAARPRADAAQAAAALAAPVHSSTTGTETGSSPASAPAGESGASSSGASSSGAASGEAASTESSTGGERSPSSEASTPAAQPPNSSTTSGASSSAASAPSSSESTPAASPSAAAVATPAGQASEATPAGGTQAAPGG